jgi:hypothetical protein
MAKFDISPGFRCATTTTVGDDPGVLAHRCPKPELRVDSIRTRARFHSLGWLVVAGILVGAGGRAVADPAGDLPGTSPDAPPRTGPPVLAPTNFRPTWDLDGTYVWLDVSGAASWIDSEWDSTFGGGLSIVRVREHDLLGTVGGSFGAARWTERGGERIWLDALAGTQIAGHMAGVSAGAIVEFSDLAHPQVGGDVGIWAFAGVTPYARVGVVSDFGAFAEIGLHIALPVFRR